MKWLFISYTVPSNPSRARVFIWRELKKLGAINYQTVWVLPYSKETMEKMQPLEKTIENYGGQILLIEGKVLNKEDEERIINAFVEARNKEYKEVIEKCEDFFQEISFEIERQNFIFAEVEENEEELEKLKAWLKKIEKRDFVNAPLRKEAIEKIKKCTKLFEEFSKRVYKESSKE
ncbi:Chromate resistance protein ChrB [Thermodesulfovibrio sp.]|uniref:Chromate resistance protein ChrB n=1 Tax=Thermodesulfovibrio sp. TaxID=2067987 RepID=UPI0030A774F8